MRKYSLLFFFIGAITMAVIVTMSGDKLKTDATPHRILDLEFAYNIAKTAKVLDAWTPVSPFDRIAIAKQNTWLDFIFLFFYSIFLFLASKAISRLFGGSFGRAGKLIARGALIAGLLDILENTGMLITLSGSGSDTIALFTTICSVAKWLLALVAVLYVLMAGVGLLRARFKR